MEAVANQASYEWKATKIKDGVKLYIKDSKNGLVTNIEKNPISIQRNHYQLIYCESFFRMFEIWSSIAYIIELFINSRGYYH